VTFPNLVIVHKKGIKKESGDILAKTFEFNEILENRRSDELGVKLLRLSNIHDTDTEE